MRKYLIISFVLIVLTRPVCSNAHISDGIMAIYEAKNIFEKIIWYANQDSICLKAIREAEVSGKMQKVRDIVVKGMEYNNGIVFSEDTTVTYNLDGRYNRFTSYVVVCDDKPTLLEDENINGVSLKMRKPLGKVQFSVFVDDILVYFSSSMNSDSLPEYIDVNVKDKNKLVIVVKDTANSGVNTALIDATLYKNDILHKPQNVDYKREEGTFLYCNNPESIKYEDTLDNNKIIYEAKNIEGDNLFFAEQNNSTGTDMYYAVMLKNNTNYEAKVSIHNKGMSLNGWTGLNDNENCWKDFFEDADDVLNILPNNSVWLVEPTKVSQYNPNTGKGVMNLIIKFSTEVPLDLKVIAFTKDYDKYEYDGEYEGYITKHSYLWGEARNYKGRTNNYPRQECNLEWEIDDNTKSGYLPVRYNNINRAGFITHITKNKHISALEKDMYEFTDPNGLCFCYNNEDYSTMTANLGNWAIMYKETISIKNNSNKNRSLDIIFKNAFLNSGVIIISPKGDIIKGFNEEKKVIKTLDISANQTTSYVLEYILPACSVGGLAHYIKLN